MRAFRKSRFGEQSGLLASAPSDRLGRTCWQPPISAFGIKRAIRGFGAFEAMDTFVVHDHAGPRTNLTILEAARWALTRS